MKESTKAYTAGLFDAEGCIGLYLSAQKTTGTRKIQSAVVIANVHLPVIKWLQSTFGGAYTKNTPQKGRPWYQWRAGEGAARFLSELLPYLHVKRKEAELILRYFEVKDTKDYEEFDRISEELRLLKDRECSTTDTLDSLNTEDKLTHAYLAGLFDGEGCITVAKASTVNKLILHVNFANTYFPLIETFKRIYSGWHQTTPLHGNNKESYRWWITKKDQQEKFLLQVLPYLIIKREQAKLALKYIYLSLDYIRVEKQKLADRIRALNRLMIQPDLVGNYESGPMETSEAAEAA